jgi:thiazole synthase
MNNDVLIIGGGVIGLAIAMELKLRGAKVTVLYRDFDRAATRAAAGMLAPDAEKITNTAMQQLCWRSRSMYASWVEKIEQITGLDTGYWPCGILAPLLETEKQKNQNSSPASHPSLDRSFFPAAHWLDKEIIHQHQPGLGKEVIGGWWYPEDAQVDNRALARALQNAVKSLGVELKEGITVTGLQQQQGQIAGIQTSAGVWRAAHYVLAAGAWTNQLFPLPVHPKKGQILSVRVPEFLAELPLTRILYGNDIYLVPRRDRRIIIGATVEDVGFTPYNTPAGIQNLLQQAIRLYPQIQDYPLEEIWWGFRPATPDELPILGTSPCQNFTFATGHYRNGILLAPITAALIADLIWEQKSDPILAYFHYSRFQAQPSSCNSSILAPSTTSSALQYGQVSKPAFSSSVPLSIPDSPLVIAGKSFTSRLMTGTGKYRSIEQMQQSILESNCQIVTVAVRRVQANAPGHEGLAEALDWTRIWMLPNTAGCKTAEEAIRVARLGREMAKLLGQEDNNFVKLEVIPDPKYLLPDPVGTLQAAEQLVKEGFAVLPYINADPVLAKRLEEIGCATVMPLAAPIGSGQGLKTAANIQIIIENAKVPVVVDAGIGTPSEAAQAMEMGADALLINSAIALAKNPPAMARAMNMATIAGRLAYLAGRMPLKDYASPSSPTTGTITN